MDFSMITVLGEMTVSRGKRNEKITIKKVGSRLGIGCPSNVMR